MPNNKAKSRKRLKHKLNANLKQYGRTRRQIKKIMMKSALKNYHVIFDGSIDEQYKSMHEHIAKSNKLAKAAAELKAKLAAAKEKTNGTS